MVSFNGFDASKVDPTMPVFDPLPKGQYVAHIIESNEYENNAETGSYVKIVWEILQQGYEGRNLWTYLNLNHVNEKAVAAAQAELSAICRATGVMTPRDSAELHGIPVLLDVSVVQKKIDKKVVPGEYSNKIKGYSSLQQQQQSYQQQPSPQQQQSSPQQQQLSPPQQQNNSITPPWKQ